MSEIRVFVAVRLSPKVQSQIQAILSVLQAIEPNLKWVAPVNLHFTLAFIGKVPEELISKLLAACHTTAVQYQQFVLQLGRLGVFPSKGKPRIVWLGVTQGRDHLQALQNTLVNALQSMGCALEKRLFVSHLTLGRAQNGKTIQAWPTLQKVALPKKIKLSVGSLELIRSDLQATGPKYLVLGSCPLLIPGHGSL